MKRFPCQNENKTLFLDSLSIPIIALRDGYGFSSFWPMPSSRVRWRMVVSWMPPVG